MTKNREIEVILSPIDVVFTLPGGRHLIIPSNVVGKFGRRMAHSDGARGEFGRPKVADLLPALRIQRLCVIDVREVCVILQNFAVVTVNDRRFVTATAHALGPHAEFVRNTIEAAPSACFNLRELSDPRQDTPGKSPVVNEVTDIITWDFDPRCETQLDLPEQLASFN